MRLTEQTKQIQIDALSQDSRTGGLDFLSLITLEIWAKSEQSLSNSLRFVEVMDMHMQIIAMRYLGLEPLIFANKSETFATYKQALLDRIRDGENVASGSLTYVATVRLLYPDNPTYAAGSGWFDVVRNELEIKTERGDIDAAIEMSYFLQVMFPAEFASRPLHPQMVELIYQRVVSLIRNLQIGNTLPMVVLAFPLLRERLISELDLNSFLSETVFASRTNNYFIFWVSVLTAVLISDKRNGIQEDGSLRLIMGNGVKDTQQSLNPNLAY